MNKRHGLGVLFLVLGLLGGCVSAPDPRPDVQIEAERKLQQGVTAFDADRYPSAAALFGSALSLYRSVDDREGIVQSHINLAQTALMVGNYAQAVEYLDLAAHMAEALDAEQEQARITLLYAHLDYRQGAYERCAGRLATLLPEFAQDDRAQGEVTALTRVAIADRARVSFQRQGDDPALWTRRYDAALRSVKPDDLMQARLERFQAELARREGDLSTASDYLDSALQRYKQLAYRRGIAATLGEQAALAIDTQHYALADELLRRSLEVRIWILDRPGAEATLNSLLAVNEQLGRPEADFIPYGAHAVGFPRLAGQGQAERFYRLGEAQGRA